MRDPGNEVAVRWRLRYLLASTLAFQKPEVINNPQYNVKLCLIHNNEMFLTRQKKILITWSQTPDPENITNFSTNDL